MKILIDCQALQTPSRDRGIGRYTESVVKELLSLEKLSEFKKIILLNGNLDEDIDFIKDKINSWNLEVELLVWHANGEVSCLYENSEWLRYACEISKKNFINQLEPSYVLNTTILDSIAHNVTVIIDKTTRYKQGLVFYDIIPYLDQSYLAGNAKFKSEYFRKLYEIFNVDNVFAISDYIKMHAVNYLGMDGKKVKSIYAGIDKTFFVKKNYTEVDSDKFKETLKIKGEFILYTGAFDSRKNHERLIEAYAELDNELKRKYQLLLVGPIGLSDSFRISEKINEHSLNEKVVVTGKVSESELLYLYANCSLYVFPSTSEGFGLPILEAMSCGAVVIGSSNSSISEILECSELLFDPFNVESIKIKIHEALTSNKLRSLAIENGERCLKKYSWNKTANIIADEVLSASVNMDIEFNYFDPAFIFELASIPYDFDSLSKAKFLKQYVKNGLSLINKKLIYLDISEACKDRNTGIQKAVNSIYQGLLKSEIYFPVPVIFDTVNDGIYVNIPMLFGLKEINFDWCGNYQIPPSQIDSILITSIDPELLGSQRGSIQNLFANNVIVHQLIYDIFPIKYKSWYDQKFTDGYEAYIKDVLADYASCICISSAVKEDLTDYAELKRIPLNSKIHSWNLGVAANGSKKKSFNSDIFTFIAIGTLEPRKNYSMLIRAFISLKLKDCKLILIGVDGWSKDESTLIKNLIKNHNNIELYQNATDEIVANLLSSSNCLIQASCDEGFGLPVFEALIIGKFVITNNFEAIKNVYHANLIKIDNANEGNLSEQIKQIYFEKKLGVIDLDFNSKYDIYNCANELTKIFEKFSLNKRGGNVISVCPVRINETYNSSPINFIYNNFSMPNALPCWSNNFYSEISFVVEKAEFGSLYRIDLYLYSSENKRLGLKLNDGDLNYIDLLTGDRVYSHYVTNLVDGLNSIYFEVDKLTVNRELLDCRQLGFGFINMSLNDDIQLPSILFDVVIPHNSEKIYLNGFHKAEEYFTWSAMDSSIYFVHDNNSANCSIEMKLSYLINEKKYVNFKLNGVGVLAADLNEGDGEILFGSIKLNRGVNVLNILIPRARPQPNSLDERSLGIAFKSITFECVK